MHKLSIVPSVAGSFYQELNFTATRDYVINFDTTFDARYFCVIYFSFNLVYLGSFSIVGIDFR